jgi:dihydrofolate reductase
VAASDNDVIGRRNELPWHLPADLQRFKALTMGKPILMGRRTHESIGRALPGRRNLVLTRGAARTTEGVEWLPDFDAAAALVAAAPELLVIGGAQLYRELLGRTQRVYLTRVHCKVADGDAFFPRLEPGLWHSVAERRVAADARNAFDMTFATLERAAAPVPA